jgi:hypothetical protein
VVVAPTTASGRDRPPIASNGPANAIPCEVEGDLAARRKVHCEYSLSRARVTSASSCGGGSGSAGFGDCACRRGSHSPSARQFQARASKVSEDVIVVAA